MRQQGDADERQGHADTECPRGVQPAALAARRTRRTAVGEQHGEQRQVGQRTNDLAVGVQVDQAQTALADDGPRDKEHQGGREHRAGGDARDQDGHQ